MSAHNHPIRRELQEGEAQDDHRPVPTGVQASNHPSNDAGSGKRESQRPSGGGNG
ncbi:hypothetical protein GJ744_006428 [Endocarpon pusillum]|uniref:Uncharacterized protein n=1 Tax=Endocarpon pusillum TaxID=364733 RepID=A0A8H7A4Y0_9EURO|nr:hypothetical protein GJ744_006428 [Endocarpon pusillum]